MGDQHTFNDFVDIPESGFNDFVDMPEQPQVTPKASGGFFSNVLGDLKKRLSNIYTEGMTPIKENVLTEAPQKILRMAGEVGGFGYDILNEGAKGIYNTLTSDLTKQTLAETGDYWKDAPIIREQIETAKGIGSAYRRAKEISPESMKNIEAGINLTGLPILKGIGTVGMAAGKEGIGVAEDLWKMSRELTPGGAEKELDKVITKGIEKGIRPTVVGKKNIGQIKQYAERAKTAVKEIIGCKDDLALTDIEGNVVKGKLPQSLKQFSEAIDQTKKGIFRQYDDLTKVAGEQGATVNLKPAIKELEDIAGKSTLQDLNPEVVKYAETRATALTERGSYTTEEAQDAITQLNKSLEAYYKNPSYENATKAGVDAVLANNIRKSLDAVIENATGGGYQELKNSYGALKTIEKEVAHRAIVDARKNIKGLVDFTDIYTSGELVAGILTLNPGMVVKGTMWKGVQQYIKAINNPNRIIKNMFSDAENIIKRRTAPVTGVGIPPEPPPITPGNIPEEPFF